MLFPQKISVVKRLGNNKEIPTRVDKYKYRNPNHLSDPPPLFRPFEIVNMAGELVTLHSPQLLYLTSSGQGKKSEKVV